MCSIAEDTIFEPLTGYLAKVPSITDISAGFSEDGYWWIKFTIDIEHPLAWAVVQELGMCSATFRSKKDCPRSSCLFRHHPT
jgi:hypothetical protein